MLHLGELLTEGPTKICGDEPLSIQCSTLHKCSCCWFSCSLSSSYGTKCSPTSDPSLRRVSWTKKVKKFGVLDWSESFTKGYVGNRLRVRTGKLPRGAPLFGQKNTYLRNCIVLQPTHKESSTSLAWCTFQLLPNEVKTLKSSFMCVCMNLMNHMVVKDPGSHWTS